MLSLDLHTGPKIHSVYRDDRHRLTGCASLKYRLPCIDGTASILIEQRERRGSGLDQASATSRPESHPHKHGAIVGAGKTG
jgi:hypothetical protein